MGILREKWHHDPVGARHPLRDGNALGLRNPAEGGGAPEDIRWGKRVGKYGDRRGRGGHGFLGDEPHGYGKDKNDDVT